MALYRFLVAPRGALGTPLRSDTLNGHLVCAAAELDGPHTASELVQDFRAGRPPFACSSAFPENMLPRPCLPPIPRRRFHEAHGDNLFSILTKYKRFRKERWLPLDIWAEQRGDLSQAGLFASWLQDEKRFKPMVKSPPGQQWREREQAQEAHNSISRKDGAVLQEGGLYFSATTFFAPGSRLHLYVETSDIDPVSRWLKHIADTGFGRDRGTGKGALDFALDETFEPTSLLGEGSHVLCLSVLSGPDLSMLRGHWEAFVKFGKVYNGFGQNNPFKKPFLALAEGAVLEPLSEAGFVLDDIHPDPEIIQITWPLTIPLTLAREEARA